MTGPLPRELNLGCGRNQRAGALNVDVRESARPDLVWDLEKRPYPLPRNYFEHIWASDVVEHLADLQGFIEEVHALLAPGGTLEITTPHFSCSNSFTDPTHRHHLGYFSFDYFTDHSPWNFYSPVRFSIAARQIVFHPSRLNRLIAWAAHKRPDLYERRWAWIFPAWFLIFRLRAEKEPAASTW